MNKANNNNNNNNVVVVVVVVVVVTTVVIILETRHGVTMQADRFRLCDASCVDRPNARPC